METTTENSNTGSMGVQYAGLGKRLFVLLYDHLFILSYIVVTLGVGIGVRVVVGPLERISPLFASPVVVDGMWRVLVWLL